MVLILITFLTKNLVAFYYYYYYVGGGCFALVPILHCSKAARSDWRRRLIYANE